VSDTLKQSCTCLAIPLENQDEIRCTLLRSAHSEPTRARRRKTGWRAIRCERRAEVSYIGLDCRYRRSHSRHRTGPSRQDGSAASRREGRAYWASTGPKYYYNVKGLDEGRGSFKTAPRGTADFQFAVYGDTRTRHDVHRRVIAAVMKNGMPDFVLHTGDLVADGADPALWPVFFDIERELLRNVAFYPSLGNHERNNHQFYDFFNLTTPYYSFDWGKAHFIVLCSDIGNAATSNAARESFWTEQVRWLEEDLAKSQHADFRFVVTHHPPITAVAFR